MSFYETLKQIWSKNDSLVCVGLDPDLSRIPGHLFETKNPIFEFNRAIIDATADLVCAYKPQFAHYAAEGAEAQLAMTIDYIHEAYPGVPVILDAKRGDIGSTAKMYAKEAFDRYRADAVTVNPFLGGDSLTPFLENKDKGVVLLCRTSNPGARDIQDLEVNGRKLYQVIAHKASYEWNYNSNVLLVVGATYPEELKEIRYIVGDMPLLVPGIGAQGGDIEAAVRNGLDSNGAGMIINSSRGIIYAGTGPAFALAAREATEALRNEINRFR
ncbi:MAG: orotidine-5'-phosphate decarboxylase [Deltaproteobacteria bacterium]|nr:orotidine-5'-phosphate decarboxylase [Deltaproteobacteria bacterium]